MILVVEDEALIRMSLADHLETEGFEVVEAPTGDRAKELITDGTPITALITDVMMPGLDGLALLEHLRQDPKTRTVPVIILSARAGEEASIEGLARHRRQGRAARACLWRRPFGGGNTDRAEAARHPTRQRLPAALPAPRSSDRLRRW